jgi:hypothetical protein
MSLSSFQRRRREMAAKATGQDDQQKTDTELEVLRVRAKELGIENAERKGEKRLREEISEAEAFAELMTLREKANGLSIENVDELDAEALRMAVEEKEAELRKNAGNIPINGVDGDKGGSGTQGGAVDGEQ